MIRIINNGIHYFEKGVSVEINGQSLSIIDSLGSRLDVNVHNFEVAAFIGQLMAECMADGDNDITLRIERPSENNA